VASTGIPANFQAVECAEERQQTAADGQGHARSSRTTDVFATQQVAEGPLLKHHMASDVTPQEAIASDTRRGA
jgi:hypothetical protein